MQVDPRLLSSAVAVASAPKPQETHEQSSNSLPVNRTLQRVVQSSLALCGQTQKRLSSGLFGTGSGMKRSFPGKTENEKTKEALTTPLDKQVAFLQDLSETQDAQEFSHLDRKTSINVIVPSNAASSSSGSCDIPLPHDRTGTVALVKGLRVVSIPYNPALTLREVSADVCSICDLDPAQFYIDSLDLCDMDATLQQLSITPESAPLRISRQFWPSPRITRVAIEDNTGEIMKTNVALKYEPLKPISEIMTAACDKISVTPDNYELRYDYPDITVPLNMCVGALDCTNLRLVPKSQVAPALLPSGNLQENPYVLRRHPLAFVRASDSMSFIQQNGERVPFRITPMPLLSYLFGSYPIELDQLTFFSIVFEWVITPKNLFDVLVKAFAGTPIEGFNPPAALPEVQTAILFFLKELVTNNFNPFQNNQELNQAFISFIIDLTFDKTASTRVSAALILSLIQKKTVSHTSQLCIAEAARMDITGDILHESCTCMHVNQALQWIQNNIGVGPQEGGWELLQSMVDKNIFCATGDNSLTPDSVLYFTEQSCLSSALCRTPTLFALSGLLSFASGGAALVSGTPPTSMLGEPAFGSSKGMRGSLSLSSDSSGSSESASVTLEDVNSMEMAMHLADFWSGIFCSIDFPSETLNNRWKSGDRDFKSPNITRLREMSKKATMWFVNEISSQSTPKKQQILLRACCDLLEASYKLGDFQTMNIIIHALEFPAVIGLKEAWNDFPEKRLQQLLTIARIVSRSDNNSKMYREEIAKMMPPKKEEDVFSVPESSKSTKASEPSFHGIIPILDIHLQPIFRLNISAKATLEYSYLCLLGSEILELIEMQRQLKTYMASTPHSGQKINPGIIKLVDVMCSFRGLPEDIFDYQNNKGVLKPNAMTQKQDLVTFLISSGQK